MKAKTIKSVISKKINEWLASIEDESVRDLARKNTIVTGGCIASMLLNEQVNDFDLYFRDHATTKAVADYYVARFQPKSRKGIPARISVYDDGTRIKVVVKSAGIASEDGATKPYEYFETQADGEASGYVGEVMGDAGEIEDTYQDTEKLALQTEDDGKPAYRPVFMSTNAITLSHKVQIVLRFYGDPDAIHENYDFVHCTNCWCSDTGNLTLRQEALEALLARELRYVGSKYPVCSVMRLRKFIQRGWSVNAGQVLKMLLQVSALDLTDPNVLEDQLTGVDSAYFLEVMAKVKEKDPEKVNAAYLVEILNRMF